MSTKIYNGYRFPADVGLSGLPEWRERVSAELSAHRRQVLDRCLFEVAASVLDQCLLSAAGLRESRAPDRPTPWASAREHWDRQLDNLARGYRAPDIDVEVEAWLSFRQDRPGKVYCRLSAENQAMHKLAVETGRLREFGYWNNTDAPDAIGQARFDRRGHIWSALLDTQSRRHPSARKQTFLLSKSPDATDFEQSEILRPGFRVPGEWRLDFERRVYNACVSTIPMSELPEDVRTGLDRGGFGAYMCYERTLRNGENEDFNQIMARARSCIPPVLDPSWFILTQEQMIDVLPGP